MTIRSILVLAMLLVSALAANAEKAEEKVVTLTKAQKTIVLYGIRPTGQPKALNVTHMTAAIITCGAVDEVKTVNVDGWNCRDTNGECGLLNPNKACSPP